MTKAPQFASPHALIGGCRRVDALDFYDWMLSLHLLAVFSIASALLLFSVLVVSGRRAATLERTQLLFRVAPSARR